MRRILSAVLLALLPAATQATDRLISAEQRREELAIVGREYVDKAPSFDAAARRRAHAIIDRTARQAERLTDQQYLLALTEIPAQADNGHDSLAVGPSPLRPDVRLPLRTVWFGERLFVSRAAPAQEDLVGGEVLRLGRLTTSQFARVLARYQGGKSQFRRDDLVWLTHNPAMLAAAGVTSSGERTPIDVRLPGGKVVSRVLKPLPADRMPSIIYPAGWLSATLSADEQRMGWHAAGNPAVPFYLQEPDRLFRTVELPDIAALYVQFRINFDFGEEKIAPFVAGVEAHLRNNPPRNLVLDLRLDTGGDNTQNRELMRSIARLVPGRIFVITGQHTFSAGIATLAAIIHDGGGKVTVVGDEVGDRYHWWSEREADLCLPHSKACFNRQVGYWNLYDGCVGKPGCFSDQFDVRVKTIEPAVYRPFTPADWLAGRDAAMDWVRAELGGIGGKGG